MALDPRKVSGTLRGVHGRDFEPTRPEDRSPGLPGFDPLDSPLSPGGRSPDESRTSHADQFPGLVDFPATPNPQRIVYRVRREGWVARRAAARARFADLHEKGGPSAEQRIVARLKQRNGLLQRARENAVHPRFNLRGRP